MTKHIKHVHLDTIGPTEPLPDSFPDESPEAMARFAERERRRKLPDQYAKCDTCGAVFYEQGNDPEYDSEHPKCRGCGRMTTHWTSGP
jgi:hypothetical protein